MKNSNHFLLKVISKGQVIFAAVMFALVIISSITFDHVSATPAISHDSPAYTVVIDAGHGVANV